MAGLYSPFCIYGSYKEVFAKNEAHNTARAA